MLRVNSASVLFVPPFECAWLSELKLEEGGGCLSFEAKGANTLIKLCLELLELSLWYWAQLLLRHR